MHFTFDPAKDAANIAKHGQSLAQAPALEWVDAWVWADERRDYGEPRQSALVPLGNRLFFVAFVDRAGVRRIISLRKANSREMRDYANHR